jgi:Flp pilus assembly pilin Flp
MLKFYVKASETLRQLRSDKRGVVSFEYIIVAAAIVGAVTLAFGAAGGAGPISAGLTKALGNIVTAIGGA